MTATVLVVDDDRAFRELVVDILRRAAEGSPVGFWRQEHQSSRWISAR